MGLTSQFFRVIDTTTVKRIPQKKFTAFFFRKELGLDGIEGGRFQLIQAIIENENRKPKQIVRVESSMIPITEDGFIDDEEYIKDVVGFINDGFGYGEQAQTSGGDTVVNSELRFTKRRLDGSRPIVTPAIEAAVARLVFGKDYNG